MFTNSATSSYQHLSASQDKIAEYLTLVRLINPTAGALAARFVVMRVLLFMFAICACSATAAADRLAVLAKLGDTITLSNGASAEITDIYGYQGFIPPVLSESGHASFVAKVKKNPSSSEVWAILRATTGQKEVVAANGDAVDGMPGVTFGALSNPTITSSGDVIFQASIVGPGITTGLNDKGYWLYNGSSKRLLVREGVSIPSEFPNLRIHGVSEAEVAQDFGPYLLSFRANLVNPGSSAAVGAGYFVVPRISISTPPVNTLARLNSSVPGISEASFSSIQRLSSRAGVGLSLSTITGPTIVTNSASPLRIGNDTVLFTLDTNEQLTKIARNGDAAPGFDGQRFYLFSNSTTKPMVTSAGVYAFAATALNSQGQGGSGIWTNRPDVLARGRGTLLARTGDVVATPGGQLSLGALFNGFSFRQHWLSEDGTIVFVAPLTGAGVNAQNNRAIFVDSPITGRALVARGGDPVPGVPSATFVNSTIGNWLLINARGDIAFTAQMAGAAVDNRNDYGVFRYADGELRLVAREGQSLPNTDGYTLLDLSWFERWMFNDQGQIIITASAAQTERGSSASQGCVFRIDQGGGIRALAVGNTSIGGFSGENGSLSSFVVANPAGVNNSSRVAGATIGTFSGDYAEAIVSVDIETTTLCPADFNSDGAATVQDIFDFLALWFAQDTGADFNRDSTVTVQDLFDFLEAWFAGCN